jgi:3',5'-cyclic-AMP phosphodiesterase
MKNKITNTIIQITDFHVFKSNETEMFGIKTNDNFESVIHYIHDNISTDNACLFLTGDLSQDETPEAYKIIAENINNLGMKAYWIPGNHDDINLMELIFEPYENIIKGDLLDIDRWRFVFMNTQLPGSTEGRINQSEMSRLDEILSRSSSREKNVCIVMHHHPIKVGSPFIDRHMLQNTDDFFTLLSKYNNISVIMTGHVHNDYSILYNNIKVETSPATCVQFSSSDEHLDLNKKIGFKLHRIQEGKYSNETILW